MRRRLAAKNPVAVATAFEHAANACNGCHQATGKAFIEVPLAMGRAIPETARITDGGTP